MYTQLRTMRTDLHLCFHLIFAIMLGLDICTDACTLNIKALQSLALCAYKVRCAKQIPSMQLTHSDDYVND